MSSGEGRAGAFFALLGGLLIWVLVLYSGDYLLTGLVGVVLAFVLFGLVGRRL